ncbi:MAG: hypothetical protein JXA90_10835, partial [Planctomycetes bacterium]|nr:hypothetical protein [Planctomycetota bacterium]
GRFCEAMAFLEYEAAEQVLDDLERALVPEPRRVDVDGGELEPERRIAAWREDLRLARLAWTAIANAWDDLSARGGRIALRWAEGRPRARLDHRGAIAAVEPGSTADEMLTARGRRGRWLRAGGPGGAGYLTDAACLADASLRQLLLRGLDPSGGGGQAAPRTAAPDASTPAAALATFLLYREGGRSYRLRGGDGGAGRTGRLASSGGEPTEHLPAEILSVEEIRRRRARALLERLLGAPAEAEEGAWEALSLEIAALLLSRSDPPDALPSRILRADYAAARARGLRAALPDDVFHGAAVELEGDSVRLAYDFRSPDQIRAFSSAGEGSALERTSAGALVRGEWRFLDGQPFRGALRVRATLHQGRSDEPPCAAVALWTAGGEPATPERTISVTKAMVKGAAWWGDYVVFASGLRRVLVDYGGDPRLEVYPASGDDAVPLPADVLLIGRGGAPLNSHEGECLWARRSESAPRANRAVEVAMDRGRAGWSIDGRSVLPSPRPSARRWLEPGDRERRGSFSLLTFGTTWRLESLEIEGDLDPRWLEERLRARVEDELAALLDARPGG